jgi:hypothetical protein
MIHKAKTRRAIIIPFPAWAAMLVVQEEQMEGSGGEGRIAWMISDWDGHRFWINDKPNHA